jgi:tRNA uridine 5-carbamoylmethylation protein Kti12
MKNETCIIIAVRMKTVLVVGKPGVGKTTYIKNLIPIGENVYFSEHNTLNADYNYNVYDDVIVLFDMLDIPEDLIAIASQHSHMVLVAKNLNSSNIYYNSSRIYSDTNIQAVKEQIMRPRICVVC